jgi:hypothetical protein
MKQVRQLENGVTSPLSDFVQKGFIGFRLFFKNLKKIVQFPLNQQVKFQKKSNFTNLFTG